MSNLKKITIKEKIIIKPSEIEHNIRELVASKFETSLKKRKDLLHINDIVIFDELPEVMSVTGDLVYQVSADIVVFDATVGTILDKAEIYEVSENIGIFVRQHHVLGVIPLGDLHTQGGKFLGGDSKQFMLYGKVYRIGDTIQVTIRRTMHAAGNVCKAVVAV